MCGLFSSYLIKVATEGNLLKILAGEFLSFMKRFIEKVKFFEYYINHGYPEMFIDILLFLWGGDDPQTNDEQTKFCFNMLRSARACLDWQKIYFKAASVSMENEVDEEYLATRFKQTLLLCRYEDSTLRILKVDRKIEEVRQLFENLPTHVFLLDMTKDNELSIILYRSHMNNM